MSDPAPLPLTAFRNWAKEGNAFIHPDLYFVQGATGTSVFTSKDLPADTTVLSCPFDMAITRDLAVGALKSIVWEAEVHNGSSEEQLKERMGRLEQLNERQILCSYIVLHWVDLDRLKIVPDAASSSSRSAFKHRPYIETLPPPSQLRTPLHFTPAEFELLQGSNLHGATADRRHEWESEWTQVRSLLEDTDPTWSEPFTWERYLTAATYLSSRAFPSTLLSLTPSVASSESSYPVLLPVIDCLNHARGHPVSWIVSDGPQAEPSPNSDPNKNNLQINLVIRTITKADTEVFNNYGPKPNAELLLGYGFVLPGNPDDTTVLKLGGSEARHEIGRASLATDPGMKGLWEEVEKMVIGQDEDRASIMSGSEMDEGMDGSWEATLEVCEALEPMLDKKIEALSVIVDGTPNVRDDVRSMISEYTQGQKDILAGILDYVETRRGLAMEQAKADGVEIPDDEESEGL